MQCIQKAVNNYYIALKVRSTAIFFSGKTLRIVYQQRNWLITWKKLSNSNWRPFKSKTWLAKKRIYRAFNDETLKVICLYRERNTQTKPQGYTPAEMLFSSLQTLGKTFLLVLIKNPIDLEFSSSLRKKLHFASHYTGFHLSFDFVLYPYFKIVFQSFLFYYKVYF